MSRVHGNFFEWPSFVRNNDFMGAFPNWWQKMFIMSWGSTLGKATRHDRQTEFKMSPLVVRPNM